MHYFENYTARTGHNGHRFRELGSINGTICVNVYNQLASHLRVLNMDLQ